MYKETTPWVVNYDANEIPPYTLPDVLTCQDGTAVDSVDVWEKKRRPELFQMFKDVMYGEIPPMLFWQNSSIRVKTCRDNGGRLCRVRQTKEVTCMIWILSC